MKKLIMFASIALASGSSWAGDWYVGGGAGVATARDASKNVDNAKTGLTSIGVSTIESHDSNAGAAAAFAGYRFNESLRAEAAYDFLGVYDLSLIASGGGSSVSGKERDTASAVSLAALVNFPISNVFSFYGKFGVASTSIKETCRLSVAACASTTDTKTTPLIGAGAEVKLGHNALRLEYEEFNKVGDENNDYTAGKFSSYKIEYVFYAE